MYHEVLSNNIAISEHIQEYFDFRESAHYKHFVFVWLLIKSQNCVIGKVSVKKKKKSKNQQKTLFDRKVTFIMVFLWLLLKL